MKGSQRQKKESQIVEVKAASLQFPLNPSIHLDPEAFTQVFSQLVFDNDLIDLEKLAEISIAKHNAQIAFEVIILYTLFSTL